MSAKAKTKAKDAREFKTPKDVENVIRPMQDIEDLRANDRSKLGDMFNGKRPYTKEEEEKFQIQINVNWGEGKRIMRDANSQLNSALLHTGTLFNCAAESGQMDKRDEWSMAFTTNIHRPLQRGKTGRRYYYTIKQRNASICLHGIGALLWTTGFKWMPRFIPLEDLLIPTETYCDFSNLRYFAVNVYLTPGELVDMALNDNAMPGWNKEQVMEILDFMKDKFSEGIPTTWRNQPEAMKQIYKENNGWYYSDAVPKIRARWFFYQQVNKPNQWYRCMILRESYGDSKAFDKFLFDGTDRPFADDISRILSVQYGDNNLVPPLKYHAVRGLGVDLYGPVETMNRLRCQFVQSVFEHLLMYFRIADPQDRERLKQIVLSQFGVLPEGLNIVKREERHQIDSRLVEEAMGQMRQIMQESSSSYIQNVNDGTSKEMTAKEAQIRLNQATVMVSTMLQSLYLQEGFFYEEIVRRFCAKNSEDPEVKSFQKKCQDDGIPDELLYDHTKWRVTPERVLGGGDRSQAQNEAGWLWANSTQFDPSVQPMLKRMAVGAILNDPNKAKMLVPASKPEATDGVIAAENVFGTLMQGQPCVLRQGIDQIGYVETLLKMSVAVVKRIQSSDNMGTMQEIAGLATVLQNVGQHIAIIGQDKRENQRVKQYSDVVGQIMNELKGFAQRLAEKQQADAESQNQNPEAAAKAQSTVMLAQVKAQTMQQAAALKAQLQQVTFQLDQRRKDAELSANLSRNEAMNRQQMSHDAMNHAAEIIRTLNAPGKTSRNGD